MWGWIENLARQVWGGIKQVARVAKAVLREAAGAIVSAGAGAAVGAAVVKAAGYHALGMLGTSAYFGMNAGALLTAGIVAGAVAGLAVYALVLTVMAAYNGAAVKVA